MQIGKDTVVSIDYTLTDDAGKVLDTSKGRVPLAYLHGAGNLIAGLESALEGKTAGEHFAVTVEPAQAYGQRDERLKQVMLRTSFKGVKRVEVGMQFSTRTAQGNRGMVVVGFDKAGDVIVDGNHPLAGKTLNFDVTVVEVREATQEEKDHGHVHGPGGHHHHH